MANIVRISHDIASDTIGSQKDVANLQKTAIMKNPIFSVVCLVFIVNLTLAQKCLLGKSFSRVSTRSVACLFQTKAIDLKHLYRCNANLDNGGDFGDGENFFEISQTLFNDEEDLEYYFI